MSAETAPDTLHDLFWKPEINPSPAEAAKWRWRFSTAVELAMRARGLPRPEAERAAFEAIVVERLNATHPDTPSNRCALCGRLEEPSAVLLPIGTTRHTWLHRDCWDPWRARRRAEAVSWLGTMKIEAP